MWASPIPNYFKYGNMEFGQNLAQIIFDYDQPEIIFDPIPKKSDHFKNGRKKMIFNSKIVRICSDCFHP
jgi:hypothetical protein